MSRLACGEREKTDDGTEIQTLMLYVEALF
jgi:hypothetical protein